MSIGLLLTFVMAFGWHTQQVDYVAAYTQAPIDCDIYMEFPRGFKVPVGNDRTNEVCLSTKDATSTDGCNSGLHAGKRSEGKVSLPLCLLTIWYYCYALTLHIAKPDLAFSWHSELNTSLGTTTRNHDSEPTKSIRSP